MKKQLDIAVLTGDLVQSTSLSKNDVELRMSSVQKAAEQISGWGAETNFTRQSGDGWQIIVRPPGMALRAALFLRSELKRTGAKRVTRIFIATGPATISSSDLNTATDPVFVASGRGLKKMPKRALMGHDAGDGVSAAVRLADHISQRWTTAQARVMGDALRPLEPSQSDIAKRHGISQQSVQQSLAAAGYSALIDAIHFLEDQ